MQVAINQNGGVGAEVSGFDAKHPDGLARLKELLYAHKLVVLKDQALSEQEFCDFSSAFGEPVPYLQENYHHSKYPLIFVSSNVKKDGQEIGVARTGGYWHSDTSFLQDPVPLTMLYPQVIPQNSRRTTMFIDMQGVYESMPAALRARLDGLNFVHSGKWRFKVRKQDVGLDLTEILQMIHAVQPPVIHPAVITHPFTGAKVLYGSRGFTIGVQGLGSDEGQALLDEVFDFAEQPQFIREFQWSLGDVIVWDNRFFAHKAGRLPSANDPVGGKLAAEEETLVYRIIIRDGQALSAPAAA